MQQRGVVGCAEKIDQMDRRLDVAGQRIAQVGIEIRQPRAVHHHIDHAGQPLPRFVVKAQPRLAYIPFHDLDLFGEKRA